MNSLTNATFANKVFPSALIYKDMYETFITRKGPTYVPYVAFLYYEYSVHVFVD